MKTPRAVADLAAAFQFLTRIPVPRFTHDGETLQRSAKFFPVVGLAVGVAAAGVFSCLNAHLPIAAASLFTVLFTTLLTGALHEDGLADCADAFGGGWSRDQVLAILKDSRIGSYGALALIFSVLGRSVLLAGLSRSEALQYIVSAHVLCRGTVLPLCFLPPAARTGASQGGRLAGRVSATSAGIGMIAAVAAAGYLLRTAAIVPILAVSAVTALSGAYCRRRIGGMTGDCFGATIQLAEMAVYTAGVWHR